MFVKSPLVTSCDGFGEGCIVVDGEIIHASDAGMFLSLHGVDVTTANAKCCHMAGGLQDDCGTRP